MKKLITLALATLFSGSLFAASIGDLKSQGVIGELSTGYIGVVDSGASQNVMGLVNDVNAKRKAIYLKQASKNNIPLAEVEKIAANRNFERTEAGHYIHVSGNWIKK
ncbi:MAG: YdbL family protein [Gammaproteobacteria bacterium]|nr:YdbL family protein [Gammaproteobacteria bacterium]